MAVLSRSIAGSALLAAAVPVAAQTADAFRATVEATRLGAGYAQMINLSAMPDLSAASYRIEGSGPEAKLDPLGIARARVERRGEPGILSAWNSGFPHPRE